MILPILKYPDKRLRIKAKPVIDFNNIMVLINNMFETMQSKNGIGLAATQVNKHWRIIVTDISKDNLKPLYFINPRIINSTDKETSEEGCLSVPNYYAKVTRAKEIMLEAYDKNGHKFSKKYNGLLAVCLQHEIDHLNGVLFVDYLSKLKQQRLVAKINKI